MSLTSVVRHSWSVANAATLSVSTSDFQKRRLLRRTYQLDSRSTNSSISRTAAWGSYLSNAAVAVLMSSLSSEMIHRSSSGRSGTGGAGVSGV